MIDNPEGPGDNLIALAGDIVSAYVANNSVPVSELPTLLRDVHSSLRALGASGPVQEEVAKPTAAQVRKSVTPDALISFIDGKPYKTLKRHLTRHGLSADAYRERFGLPSQYPMVAANYSERRSQLAHSAGLGQQRRRSAAAE